MVLGKVDTSKLAEGYSSDPMRPLAESFVNVTRNMLDRGVDMYSNLSRALIEESVTNQSLKDFFVNQSCDTTQMTAEQIQEHVDDMEQLYSNDRTAMLEASVGASVNPMVGMSLPLHKFILMNMVFDKGAIPKVVAGQPRFTISMEYRYLVDTEGNEIDMFKDQNLMTDAINKSVSTKEFELPTLPFTSDTEIISTYLNGVTGVDHLAIDTYISGVKVSQFIDEGDLLPDENGYIHTGCSIATAETKGEKDVWVRVKYLFTPAYGSFGRAVMQPFEYKHKALDGSDVKVVSTKGLITGRMENDRIDVQVSGKIKGIKVMSKLDSSLVTQPLCSVRWKSKDDWVEIGNAPGISTPITPQECKDISTMYNINQVTKYMSLIKTVQANYKDDMIHRELDNSFETMGAESKRHDVYDFAPREGYLGDHVTWRRDTFFDKFDYHVSMLLQVLNDPNVTISVFGAPEIISRLTPQEYSYQSPGKIGPVELDYTKTVFQSTTKRSYQFISSDKLRGTTQLIIVLCPNGTDRIIYRIYDYQLYLSNEIRDPVYQQLPNIYSFERWKFVEYQPVQGRIDILHPSGITDHYDVIQTKQV